MKKRKELKHKNEHKKQKVGKKQSKISRFIKNIIQTILNLFF